MPKLIPRVGQNGAVVGYSFYCPACKSLHAFNLDTDSAPWWTFDGNLDEPSFSPSLRYVVAGCHLYVSSGQIHYCNDCRHEFRGQVVPMVNWNAEKGRAMTTRDEEIKKWTDAGYSPAAAAAAVDALSAKTSNPTVAPALKLVATENPTVTATAAHTHAERCGAVGDTGKHGDLGSNAKDW